MTYDYEEMRRLLFDHYDLHRRDLPWRSDRNAYKTWVSEVMLQQTRVSTVIPYFCRFIQQFPTISALAHSSEDNVLKAWEGLGYYSRATNLQNGARYIVSEHQGIFPFRKEDILKIPGVGPYIAAAILSMAFGKPEPSIDGNLIRVISRLHALSGLSSSSKTQKQIAVIASKMISEKRPGDFNEAVMDLGATICTPKSPSCDTCPLESLCIAAHEGCPELYPGNKKTASLQRYAFTICPILYGNTVYIKKRAASGLLAGLYEFLMIPGHYDKEDLITSIKPEFVLNDSSILSIEALPDSEHRFSHLIWDMKGYLIRLVCDNDLGPKPLSEKNTKGLFVPAEEMKSLPFPTAIRVYRDAVLASARDLF